MSGVKYRATVKVPHTCLKFLFLNCCTMASELGQMFCAFNDWPQKWHLSTYNTLFLWTPGSCIQVCPVILVTRCNCCGYMIDWDIKTDLYRVVTMCQRTPQRYASTQFLIFGSMLGTGIMAAPWICSTRSMTSWNVSSPNTMEHHKTFVLICY